MSIKYGRPHKSVGVCKFCGLNIWNKRRRDKHGCCTKACKISWMVLKNRLSHPLGEDLRRRYALYGGSIYTTLRGLVVREAILRRDGHKCLRCGSTTQLHVDQVVPLSWRLGGFWTTNNLQPLCRSCNLAKSNKTAADYRNRPSHEG